MLIHKDVISVLLGDVGSKPTFAKLVHLYFSFASPYVTDPKKKPHLKKFMI